MTKKDSKPLEVQRKESSADDRGLTSSSKRGMDWERKKLFEDLMKISELDADIADLIYKEGLSKKEILEKKKIRPWMTYYVDGTTLVSFQRDEDEND